MGSLYIRFRSSPAFLLFLFVFLIAWISAHNLFPGFDPDFGILNLILSSEASISVALLIMDQAKQERASHKQLEYMVHMMEAINEALENRKIIVDEAN